MREFLLSSASCAFCEITRDGNSGTPHLRGQSIQLFPRKGLGQPVDHFRKSHRLLPSNQFLMRSRHSLFLIHLLPSSMWSRHSLFPISHSPFPIPPMSSYLRIILTASSTRFMCCRERVAMADVPIKRLFEMARIWSIRRSVSFPVIAPMGTRRGNPSPFSSR